MQLKHILTKTNRDLIFAVEVFFNERFQGTFISFYFNTKKEQKESFISPESFEVIDSYDNSTIVSVPLNTKIKVDRNGTVKYTDEQSNTIFLIFFKGTVMKFPTKRFNKKL